MLYGDDNSSAGNNTYEKKLNVYRAGKKDQSQGSPCDTFVLVKQLVDEFPDKFTHEEIDQRAKELARIAVKIW